MKKKKTRQKRRLRKGPFILILFFILLFFIFNNYIVIASLLEINASSETKKIAQRIVSDNNFYGFISKNAIKIIPLNSAFIDKGIHCTIHKKSLFRWSLDFYEPNSFFCIQINDYIYPCEKNCSIITIPSLSGSIPTDSISTLYSISIETEHNSSNNSISDTNPEGNFLILYEHKVRPFVNYLIHSPSHLGPLVDEIQYSEKEGLSFYKTTKSNHRVRYIVGSVSNFNTLEKKINKIEQYLYNSDTLLDYNTIDLRFFEQAVCSTLTIDNNGDSSEETIDENAESSEVVNSSPDKLNP